jgi:hypothetical protein
MRLRRIQHSGTHCVAFFGTQGRQGIRHPRSIYDRRLLPIKRVFAQIQLNMPPETDCETK